VLLNSDRKTLIEKRIGAGIWQNLYQFPLFESYQLVDLIEINKQVESLEYISSPSGSIELFKNQSIVHKLSHQNISISFWIIRIKSLNTNSISFNKINSFPFPKPISNFLSIFNLQ
jgi:A/G-specific adenine glycosylase